MELIILQYHQSNILLHPSDGATHPKATHPPNHQSNILLTPTISDGANHSPIPSRQYSPLSSKQMEQLILQIITATLSSILHCVGASPSSKTIILQTDELNHPPMSSKQYSPPSSKSNGAIYLPNRHRNILFHLPNQMEPIII